MAAAPALEAASIWGLLPVLANNSMNSLWWDGFRRFRAGWAGAHPAHAG